MTTPNTGLFQKSDGSVDTGSVVFLAALLSAPAITYFVFSRNYKIVKKSHLQGKITFM